MTMISRFLAVLAIALPASIAGPALAQETTLGTGTFVGASGHETSGGVSIVQTAAGTTVVFGSDFSFDGAPDPKIGFGHDGFDEASLIAPLQSNSGAQTYVVPATLDVSQYNEVYVWCEEFSVPLGVARLQ